MITDGDNVNSNDGNGQVEEDEEEGIYQCHETFEEYKHLMSAAQFWVEGVSLLVIGIFGMAGNVMTIVVLRRIDSNTTFNRLLMSLGKKEGRQINNHSI